MTRVLFDSDWMLNSVIPDDFFEHVVDSFYLKLLALCPWHDLSGPLDFRLVIQVLFKAAQSACMHRLHPCLMSLAEDGGN